MDTNWLRNELIRIVREAKRTVAAGPREYSQKFCAGLLRNLSQGRTSGPRILINLEEMPSSGSRVLARCVPHAILITGHVVDEGDQLPMTCRSPAANLTRIFSAGSKSFQTFGEQQLPNRRKLSKKLAHPAILAIPSPLLGDVARARNPEFVRTQANGSEEGNGEIEKEKEKEGHAEQEAPLGTSLITWRDAPLGARRVLQSLVEELFYEEVSGIYFNFVFGEILETPTE
ncbi:hypothetical protein WN51_11276 [Melipona quadrifasciata]|uniref:Uncharacterized protein n=1 Tax=Melipona quadrifasciata TaxID=166423 RepID=A0A0N0U6H8_9HYME|nr:hypothetical protein WN51_11276 [Melipona quadrifasciata]